MGSLRGELLNDLFSKDLQWRVVECSLEVNKFAAYTEEEDCEDEDAGSGAVESDLVQFGGRQGGDVDEAVLDLAGSDEVVAKGGR